MNFIRKDNHIVIGTDFGQFLQFFFLPNHSSRVVRITQNQYPYSLYGTANQIQIHAIMSVHFLQRAFHQATVVTCHQPGKRMVHRRHNHNLVARIRETVDSHAQTRYNAWYKIDFFLLYRHAITFLYPSDNRLIVIV